MVKMLIRRCPPGSGAGQRVSGHGWVISAILAFIASSRRPASATGHWSSGCPPTPGAAAEVAAATAALNARRASEYWTLARIEWPHAIALVVKTSPGVPTGCTLVTRNAGVHRDPRPANASTASAAPGAPGAPGPPGAPGAPRALEP